MEKVFFILSALIMLGFSGCHHNDTSSDYNDTNDTEVGGAELYEDWMKSIADTKSIADITIPGTHDSASYRKDMGFHNYSQTQVQSIGYQLRYGIRALDLRVGTDGRMWHGTGKITHLTAINTKITFDYALSQMTGFLSSHPTETILATFKQGGPTKVSDAEFGKYIHSMISKYGGSDRFYSRNTDNTFPTMGEARGKIVVFQRYEYKDPFGYYIYWPDQTTGSYHSQNGYNFYAQDWYKVTPSDYDKKTEYFKNGIDAAQSGGDDGKLYLNFMSGEDVPAHWLTTTAQALNNNAENVLGSYQGDGKAGIIFINFAADNAVTPSLVRMILSVNPEF